MNPYELIYLYFLKDEEALPLLISQFRPITTVVLKDSYEFCRSDAHDRQDYYAMADLVMVDAIEHYRLNVNTPFEAFYKTCLKNRLIDAGRKSSRDYLTRPFEVISLDRQISSTSTTYIRDLVCPAREIQRDRAMDRVEVNYLIDSLRKQSDPLQYAIFNEYAAGYSMREISQRHSLSIKKVRILLEKTKTLLNSLTEF